MKEINLNYQIGQYVGEYIFSHYLPTLSTDMMKSNNIIKLSDADTETCETLNKALMDSYTWNGGSGDKEHVLHTTWLKHQNKMADKYLKHELECLVPKIYPKNMKQFKDGIINTLWNCDLCWYSLKPNDIEFIQTDEYAWCSIINLKLDTK